MPLTSNTEDVLNALTFTQAKGRTSLLDAVYMAATQALTGSGGWPMSVFCTPDGRPFYAGTYFPPVERHGMTDHVQQSVGTPGPCRPCHALGTGSIAGQHLAVRKAALSPRRTVR